MTRSGAATGSSASGRRISCHVHSTLLRSNADGACAVTRAVRCADSDEPSVLYTKHTRTPQYRSQAPPDSETNALQFQLEL